MKWFEIIHVVQYKAMKTLDLPIIDLHAVVVLGNTTVPLLRYHFYSCKEGNSHNIHFRLKGSCKSPLY